MRPYPVLEFAVKTDTGLVRLQNEDATAISSEHSFAVLADGMGGYNAGEVASGMAVEMVTQFLDKAFARLRRSRLNLRLCRKGKMQQLMADAVHRANEAILDAAMAEPQFSGMGTTLLVAAFHGKTLTIAHVGDSRAYRLRRGEFVQLTRDHSVLQEQVDAGVLSVEESRLSRSRHLLTRAVGVGRNLLVETRSHEVEPEDMYMLCSDGLSDMLSNAEIAEVVRARAPSLQDTCSGLVELANASGGKDNISVILIRVARQGSGELLRNLLL